MNSSKMGISFSFTMRHLLSLLNIAQLFYFRMSREEKSPARGMVEEFENYPYPKETAAVVETTRGGPTCQRVWRDIANQQGGEW
jgi:hypothetical protein